MDEDTKLYKTIDWAKKGFCGLLIGSAAATYAFCPGRFSVADLNNDGREDIVVNYVVGESSFMNDGRGNFLSVRKFYREKRNALEREIEIEKKSVEEKAKNLK